MKNIQTHAKKLNKKPNKEVAQNLIEQMYTDNSINSDYKEHLAGLYKYFQPPVKKKPKDLKEWVMLARCKDPARYYLNEMYYKDGVLYGCDGHRLHMLKLDVELMEGYYDSKLNHLDIEGTFPDVTRIIPSKSFTGTIKLDDAEIQGSGKDSKHIFMLDDLKIGFRSRYIIEAFLNDKEAAFSMSYKHPSSPLLIEFNDRSAVIMPTRINNINH